MAEAAIHAVVADLRARMHEIADPDLRERIADLEDTAYALLAALDETQRGSESSRCGGRIEHPQLPAVQHRQRVRCEVQPRAVQQQVRGGQRTVRAADDGDARRGPSGETPAGRFETAGREQVAGQHDGVFETRQQRRPGDDHAPQRADVLPCAGRQHQLARDDGFGAGGGSQDGLPAPIGQAAARYRFPPGADLAPRCEDGGMHRRTEGVEERRRQPQRHRSTGTGPDREARRMIPQGADARVRAALEALQEGLGQRVRSDRIAAQRTGPDGRTTLDHDQSLRGKLRQQALAGRPDEGRQAGRAATDEQAADPCVGCHRTPPDACRA